MGVGVALKNNHAMFTTATVNYCLLNFEIVAQCYSWLPKTSLLQIPRLSPMKTEGKSSLVVFAVYAVILVFVIFVIILGML